MTLSPRVFSAVGIPLAAGEIEGGAQADIVLDGLEQAGDSYELRIFVNEADANTTTELDPAVGYAGSIHIYGYGGMLPDDEQDEGAGKPRMPMTRRRIATEVIRAAAAKASQMTVTLVPVAYGSSEPAVHLENIRVSVLVH